MGNNKERLSEDEERSCQRIEEALELYEANGEDALEEITGMLSKDEFEIFMDEVEMLEDEEDDEDFEDDLERVDEMAVFRCLPATMKASEELTNACCAVFPSYSVYEILKSSLKVVQTLDSRAHSERIDDGYFIFCKDGKKIMDSLDIPLSHRPADKYEHIEEFQEFLSNVADYLDRNIPSVPPKEYPEDYKYTVSFVNKDGTKEILVISIENTKSTKLLSAKCFHGHKGVAVRDAALKSYAQGWFPGQV